MSNKIYLNKEEMTALYSMINNRHSSYIPNEGWSIVRQTGLTTKPSITSALSHKEKAPVTTFLLLNEVTLTFDSYIFRCMSCSQSFKFNRIKSYA